MNPLPLSVTIIAFNEEHSIANAVQSVQWAEEVVVVDSGSTDKTRDIARNLGAKVIHNPWPGYGAQKNFADKQATHDWVLNIDADEVITPELAREIQETLGQVAKGQLKASGFFIPRKTFFLGRWIRHGGWYPNYLLRLANRRQASWTEPFVHEQLKVNGNVVSLKHHLHHYAFPSIRDQILTNLRFSQLGAADLRSANRKPSVARLIMKPIGKFLETYLIKKGFLDGLPGFIIAVNAAHSMFLKYAFLCEEGIRIEHSDHR